MVRLDMPHSDSRPVDTARALGAAIAVAVVLGMGAMFHFLWTQNIEWALFWWSLTATAIPAGVWIAWRLVKSRHVGAAVSVGDIFQPAAIMLLAVVSVMVMAALAYG